MWKRTLLTLFSLGLLLGSVSGSSPAAASITYRDTILADGPMMYWRLGEPSGTVAYDQTENDRDAVYVRSPTLGGPGAIVADPDTSVNFENRQLVRWMPDGRYRGSFTAEAWVRPRLVKNIQTFLDTRTPNGEWSFDLKLYGTPIDRKAVGIDIGNGRKWLTVGAFPFDWQVDAWYQVAAVVTPAGVAVYVDGSAIGSMTHSGTPLLFGKGHSVIVGGNTLYKSEWFRGDIDEVAFYPYALSADQIAVHYAAGIGP